MTKSDEIEALKSRVEKLELSIALHHNFIREILAHQKPEVSSEITDKATRVATIRGVWLFKPDPPDHI